MQIKDVEKLTGISAKNIRFYESKGLINVERRKNNDYRIYSEDNIYTLKKIKILRYLDFSIAEIEILLNADEDIVKAALEEKEKTLFDMETDAKSKRELCKQLKKEYKDTKQKIEEVNEAVEFFDGKEWEDIQKTLIKVSCNSLAAQICLSLALLGPMLWLFVNLNEKKWEVLHYNIPIALLSTVILTFSWISYIINRMNNPRRPKDKGTPFILLILVLSIIITIIYFAFVERMQILFMAPSNWLFYQMSDVASLTMLLMFEVPLIIFFISRIHKKYPHPNWEGYFNFCNFVQKHKAVFIVFDLLIIYICFTSVTFVTEEKIIIHNALKPMWIEYEYSDVTEIKMGFWGKKFALNPSHKAGEYYYQINVKGNWLDFNATSTNESIKRYEDTYLELEEFDKKLMTFDINKISSARNIEYVYLDQRYIDRFVRIINNK